MTLKQRIENIRKEIEEEGIVTNVDPKWVALCEVYGWTVDLYTGQPQGLSTRRLTAQQVADLKRLAPIDVKVI